MEETKALIVPGDAYLAHYGVKGMKWGVRKDRSATRELRKVGRHVSATRKHYISSVKAERENEEAYSKAERAYQKRSGQVAITKSARQKKASDLAELSTQLRVLGVEKSELRTRTMNAKKWYDANAAKYKSEVDRLVSRFGAENVGSLKTKDYKLGKDLIENMINTGVDFTSVPVLGKSYQNKYISKLDTATRRENIEDEARKRTGTYY